jgi:hypothetical protein
VRTRAKALVLLVALVALLTGCDRDRVVELPDWQLTSELVAAKPVHFPAHLNGDLPSHETKYALRASVTLPGDLRGRPLTFELPMLRARSSLFVDGEEMTPLDPRMRQGYRGTDQSAFRIPARLTERGALALEIVVDYRQLLASRVEVAPRISEREEGDTSFVLVRELNEWTAAASGVVVLFTAFVYGLVYLRDRRRAAYGWFVVESCGAAYTLTQHGVLQLLVGRYEQSVVPPLIAIGELASVHFTHALFKLGKPSRAWTWAAGVSVVAALAMPSPFLSPKWVVIPSTLMTIANVNYQAYQMARVWRRDGPSLQAGAIFVSWILLGILGTPDMIYWFDLGDVARGFHGVSLGLAIMATLQAVALGKEHHEALVESERLNDELRRQIASRADTLAAALMRASTLGTGGRILEIGDRLDGRYEIVRRLGEGAAGIVYEVRRLSDGGHFALKLLRAAADTTDMARFAREAQLIAKLDHPNVVRIVDVDVNATGFFYIVVELIEGRSLGEHRARFGDARWGLRVLGQVASGLAAIHAQGIMHRDLKPGNILVTENGARELSVRIADFGIAGQAGLHDLGPGGSAIPSGDELLLTTTGMWIGTPRYMAPELVDGAKKADLASDVFAFGLVAFEVLTGSLPYDGSAALRALKGETYVPPPSIRARCPTLDVAVADVIDRCLRAEPEARPLAKAVADAFERYRSGASSGSALDRPER